MERPNHLNVGDKSASSKAGSLAIVIGIHIAVIFGLIAALNQGALMKQLQEIKATVDTAKEKPKAPPPPPPDLVKPPPPAPVQVKPPPPPAPPPKAVVAASDPLRPIMRTHTIPPYPPISVRLNESGTTLMEVHIATSGSVDDCKILNSSSSERLDTAACDYVKRVWRWQPPTNQGAPVAVSTRVSVKWDLKDAK